MFYFLLMLTLILFISGIVLMFSGEMINGLLLVALSFLVFAFSFSFYKKRNKRKSKNDGNCFDCTYFDCSSLSFFKKLDCDCGDGDCGGFDCAP